MTPSITLMPTIILSALLVNMVDSKNRDAHDEEYRKEANTV